MKTSKVSKCSEECSFINSRLSLFSSSTEKDVIDATRSKTTFDQLFDVAKGWVELNDKATEECQMKTVS